MRLDELTTDPKLEAYAEKIIKIPATIISKFIYSFFKKIRSNFELYQGVYRVEILEPEWYDAVSKKKVITYLKAIEKYLGQETLNNFLQHISKFESKETMFPKIAQTLLTDCSKIIKVYKETEKFLYRGIDTLESFLESPINKNRTPLFLRNDQQQLFDNILLKKGFTAVRGNSIFVTPSISVANNWGVMPYIVFPVDDFEYTWFKEQRSTYVYDHISNIYTRSEMTKEIRRLKPTNKNLSEAILTNQEVLITGSKYYGVNAEHMEQLKEWIKGL